jgi:hypothetical protein
MFSHFVPLILASGPNTVPNQSASLATLSVRYAGIEIIYEPRINPITGLVTNGQAATWYEDGPMTVTAVDVAKLGQDTAVWGMAAFAATVPAGIVKLSALQATPTVLEHDDEPKSKK